MGAICSFRDLLNKEIFFPIFLLIFAVGLLLFVWGLVEFLLAQNGVGVGDKSAKDGLENGKKHMLWGVVGMFIIFAAYSLVTVIVQFVLDLGGGTAAVCPSSGIYRGF